MSVFRCLYDGAARGQFAAVVNRQELWQLLATITIRKVIDHQRLLKKQKRGGGQVRGDSVLKASDGDGWGRGSTRSWAMPRHRKCWRSQSKNISV